MYVVSLKCQVSPSKFSLSLHIRKRRAQVKLKGAKPPHKVEHSETAGEQSESALCKSYN